MDKNWCALLIAILREKPCTREQAVELYDKGRFTKNRRKSKKEIEDMVKFREMNMTFEEIADIFCADKGTVCRLINSFKNKKKLPARS
ncbi:TPA: hypothetical protein ACXNW8_003437 [Clostridium botulinum]